MFPRQKVAAGRLVPGNCLVRVVQVHTDDLVETFNRRWLHIDALAAGLG